jgi:membrane protein required for colicin V production
MNVLDIIFIVILLLTGIRCLIRGLATELSSKLAVVAALVCGFLMYRIVGGWINLVVPLGILAPVLGFLLAAALAFLLVKILGHSAQAIIDSSSNLNTVDSILGLVFGLLEGLAIVLVILAVLHYQTFFDVASLLEKSFISRFLMPFLRARLPAAPTSGQDVSAVSGSLKAVLAGWLAPALRPARPV